MVSIADRAPLNDTRLLARTDTFPNDVIRGAAAKAFRRHLWYFSEHLVGLSFFDPRVEVTVKRAMANNLNSPPIPKNLKRLDGSRFDYNSPLDTYVTQRTAEFFDLIVKNGRDKALSYLAMQGSSGE